MMRRWLVGFALILLWTAGAVGGLATAGAVKATAGAVKPLHVFASIPGDVCYRQVPKHGRPYYNCRPTSPTTTIAVTTTTKSPSPPSTTSTTTQRPVTTTTLPPPATSTTTTTQPPSTPATQLPPTTTTTVAPPPPPGPFTVTPSSQWAGYLSTGGTTTSATGAWTVAKVSCSATEALGSTWLGVGGFDGSALLQIGTYDQCIGGQEQHGGFIEEYPGGEANLPLVFSPGDVVSVSLSQSLPGTWSFSMTDHTNGQSSSGTATYSGGGGAEWMTEAFGNSGGIPLPIGDRATFTNLTVNGSPAAPTQGWSMPHATPSNPASGYRIIYG